MLNGCHIVFQSATVELHPLQCAHHSSTCPSTAVCISAQRIRLLFLGLHHMICLDTVPREHIGKSKWSTPQGPAGFPDVEYKVNEPNNCSTMQDLGHSVTTLCSGQKISNNAVEHMDSLFAASNATFSPLPKLRNMYTTQRGTHQGFFYVRLHEATYMCNTKTEPHLNLTYSKEKTISW